MSATTPIASRLLRGAESADSTSKPAGGFRVRRSLPFRFASGAALFCLTLCAPSLVLAQVDRASLGITSARMIDDHTLEVNPFAQFLPSLGPGSTDVGSISISMTLNGKALSAPTTPSCLWQRPANTNVVANPSLRIDLIKAGVPRFTKNQKFTITAVLSQTQSTKNQGRTVMVTARRVAVILLPVILIPGIDPGTPGSIGGDGTWPALEAKLRFDSDTLIQNAGLLGIGYRRVGDLSGYPTLKTAVYKRNSDSFAVAAASVQADCTFFQQTTYADAVNIIGHSKGGVVARQFVLNEGKNAAGVSKARVNQLIMCQAPHLGSVAATPLIDPVFQLAGYNYRNLYPVWNWYRGIPFVDYVIPFGFDNLELVTLDVIPMPTTTVFGPIAYTIIYSSNWPTVWTLDAYVLGGPGFTTGDAIVPTFSQLGRFADPNTGLLLGARVPSMAGLTIQEFNIPGIHVGYMETAPVMAQLSFLLLKDI